jgi:hypothetical protein
MPPGEKERAGCFERELAPSPPGFMLRQNDQNVQQAF